MIYLTREFSQTFVIYGKFNVFFNLRRSMQAAIDIQCVRQFDMPDFKL